jgi:hypothetical protein
MVRRRDGEAGDDTGDDDDNGAKWRLRLLTPASVDTGRLSPDHSWDEPLIRVEADSGVAMPPPGTAAAT